MSRRPDGALESAVLQALWARGAPSSPADVIDQMGTDLAYTSIATILGRLCDKELVERSRQGRSFKYTATSSEADLTGRRIKSILAEASDRESALAGFAQALDADEVDQLAAILEQYR